LKESKKGKWEKDKCSSSSRASVKRAPSGLVSGAVRGNGKLLFPHGNYCKYYSSRRKTVSNKALRQNPVTGLERDVRLKAIREVYA